MASVTVYDRSTGTTYTINIAMDASVLSDVHDGGLDHYILFSTSERTAHGESIPDRMVRVFSGDLTVTCEAEIAEIIREIVEGFSSSSSVEVGSSSQSSLNSSSSSLNSSSSTQSSLNSSSRSTSSASTKNSSSSSASSVSSGSTASSASTSSATS